MQKENKVPAHFSPMRKEESGSNRLDYKIMYREFCKNGLAPCRRHKKAKTNVCAATLTRKRIRGFLVLEANLKLLNPVSGFEASQSSKRN